MSESWAGGGDRCGESWVTWAPDEDLFGRNIVYNKRGAYRDGVRRSLYLVWFRELGGRHAEDKLG